MKVRKTLLVALVVMGLTSVVHAAQDACRTAVNNVNHAAQDYRTATRDVALLCTKKNGDCLGAKAQAEAVLDQLLSVHQIMVNTCNAGVEVPPTPAPTPTIPGSLVITEIMVNPRCAGGEWFEIYNPTSGPFDLRGLTIGSGNAGKFTINTSLIISSGGLVVFVHESGKDCVTIPTKYVYSAFILANVGGVLEISNRNQVIDFVEYTLSWPLMLGASMSLDPDFFNASSNDSPSAWCSPPLELLYNEVDAGTPGNVNVQCP